MILPAGLRGYERDDDTKLDGPADIGTCVMLAMPELQLYLRTHEYFMGAFPAPDLLSLCKG